VGAPFSRGVCARVGEMNVKDLRCYPFDGARSHIDELNPQSERQDQELELSTSFSPTLANTAREWGTVRR
jgi:hypothetical protein